MKGGDLVYGMKMPPMFLFRSLLFYCVFSCNDSNDSVRKNVNDQLTEPCLIIARGFPWKIGRTDVLNLFSDVCILNGENGIQINKNIAMEAYFKVTTENDIQKALAHSGQKFELRTIYGNILKVKSIVDSNKYFSFPLILSSHFKITVYKDSQYPNYFN